MYKAVLWLQHFDDPILAPRSGKNETYQALLKYNEVENPPLVFLRNRIAAWRKIKLQIHTSR